MKTACSSVALCLLILWAGCRFGSDPVVVRVFYYKTGPTADRMAGAMFYIGRVPLRTAAGREILLVEIVQSSEKYKQGLSNGRAKGAQLIVFDSVADRVRSGVNLSTEAALCAPKGECVAGIPSWVSVDERAAAELVLKKLVEAFKQDKL